MIILKPIATAQIVKFIPTRVGIANKLILVNEITNVSTEYNVTTSVVSFYNQFSKILNLEEGHFYIASFYNNNTLIHRDKVFCTEQNVDTYSVNKDEYVVNNQDIIFYE
jgi:hypothetical protein